MGLCIQWVSIRWAAGESVALALHFVVAPHLGESILDARIISVKGTEPVWGERAGAS